MTMKYWEDLIGAGDHTHGPLTFTSDLLDHLLDLMGEKHPVHDDQQFAMSTGRSRRIVPGAFIHSITSGWIVQHGSPTSVIGMRSSAWDFVRPLYPDVPFWFVTSTVDHAEIDSERGRIDTRRRVVDEAGRAYAIGRLSAVFRRRPETGESI